MAILTRAFIQDTIDIHALDAAVAATVARATENPKTLFLFMQRYASWNGYAGPLVAELAGKIGQCRDMFFDPKEPVEVFADRATEVASLVFYATIDEHRDREYAVSHRSLAQATLKGIATFYRITPEEQLRLSVSPRWLPGLVADTADGYAHITQHIDNVVEALGFHIASVMFAAREYRVLDTVLRERCPDLTDYLKKIPSSIGGKNLPAYAWIEIHAVGEVEEDHAYGAFAALDLASGYVRDKDEADVRKQALRGYRRFADLQSTFFKHVDLDCAAEANS
ncbi:MAG TPA: hypothetical protein VJS66_02830 [Burkholderiales bacterium]|nr:hypothetical protein [Burkholderiales bacterium]